ncbi:condensation domain-containing protein [Novispirillum itersonii]|uniref:Amino acid adenylation domain-containing protein/thioester reductase-like protein n=1 Tax=Novispirillum itersonii TaxID=189 RepID=A0A7W9ZKG8_NOVIT|nr:condensation domain-containing protein [Novispirillum itersonii]MBB6212157.1 amino acid adenylation domain-containing protein/thioester reductase-like protein [Novispirillum itersonii]
MTTSAPASAPAATALVDAYAATPLQLGMLYHVLANPDGALFLQHYTMTVDGPFDVAAYVAGWQEVANRHPALRTSFHWQGLDRCMQAVSAHAVIPVRQEDWSDPPATGQEQRLRALIEEDRQQPFDFERPPLLRLTIVRLSPNRHAVILAVHHLITDGWSLTVGMEEVAAVYAARTGGRAVSLPPAPAFRGYADWLARQDLPAARAYWSRELDGVAASRLPLRQEGEPTADSPSALRYAEQVIPAGETAGLTAGLRRLGLTPATLVQAAWALLLSRFEHQDRVLFAVASATRPPAVPGIDRLFGPLMAILPCAVTVDGHQTVRDWMAAIQAAQLAARDHDFLSPAEYQRLAGFSPYDPFLTSMVVQEDMPAPRSPVWEKAGLVWKPVDTWDRTAYPLTLFVYTGETLLLRLGYDRRVFTAEAASALLDQVHSLCLSLIRQADQPLGTVTLRADPAARPSCGTVPAPQDTGVSLWTRLEAALSAVGPVLLDDQGRSLSTGPDLLDAAARLDAGITTVVPAGQPVALWLDPGVDYVTAILACLRRGSPYALLDPMLPAAAVAERLKAAAISGVVTSADRWADLSANPVAALHGIIAGDPSHLSPPAPRPALTAEAPVAMVWTSGSTGTPKAVVLTQAGVVNRLLWDRTAFHREDTPRGLLKTSPAFVDSIAEVLQPLFDGFPAVIPDPDAARTPSALLEVIRRTGPTRLVLTPSLLRALLEADPDPAPWPLHRLHLSGEPLPTVLLPRLKEKLRPEAVVLNIYGSSEVTADVTAAVLDLSADPAATQAAAVAAIGRPLPGCTLWLLDATGQPVPPGAVGEIHVAGVCLALGYHQAPDRTALAFRDWTAPDGTPTRLYATGDLARQRPDGALVHLGRKDGQIKIRGVRIEPAEIEARLLDMPGIRAAVVGVIKPKDADPRLVAWVEPAPAASHGADNGTPDTETPETGTTRADQWRSLYDRTYQDVVDGDSPLDDFRIWQSAVTGEPIPASHMQAWVKATLDLVREGPVTSVLEVGCGQGLLLGRLAAETAHYTGTDISETALTCIRHLQQRDPGLAHVGLLHQPADQPVPAGMVPPEGYQVALLSSVVQYFPDAAYLLRVLETVAPVIAHGGRIILSDLRPLHLQSVLAAEIMLARSPDPLDRHALLRRLHELTAHETELLVDPRLFPTLKAILPRLSAIEARPKPGVEDNELNSYRYDVVLWLDQAPAAAALPDAVLWSGQDDLAARLATGPDTVLVSSIPHRRLTRPGQALALLDDPDITDAGRWRTVLAASPEREATDPATLRALAERFGYHSAIGLDLSGDPSQFRAAFVRTALAPPRLLLDPAQTATPDLSLISRPYDAPAATSLTARIRDHLRRSLPPAFVPDHVVTVREWPLSASRKVLKHRLPPVTVPSGEDSERPAPQGPTEQRLATLWQAVLGDIPLGREDEFFDRGGNSLMMTQLAFSIGKSFAIKYPLRAAFAAPTLQAMAASIEAIIAGASGKDSTAEQTLITADVAMANAILPPQDSAALPSQWPEARACVLHTGSGSLLSQWILRRLAQDPACTVLYLGGDRDPETARRRIAEEWTAYGFGRLDLLDRVEIIPGRLDLPQLGLDTAAWDDLGDRVDVILHAGARISMTESYAQLRAANVLGTRELLRLCVHKRLKPLHAVGSFAIIDHSLADRDGLTVTEDSPLPSWAGLENGYRKSRWVADALMQRAIARGLPVTIHRMTPISGDSFDGRIDAGEIAWRMARAIVETAAVPAGNRPLDLLPVDQVVEAMLTLARDPQGRPAIHHITGGQPLSWADVADALRGLGYPVETLPPSVWVERARTVARQHPTGAAAAVLPLVSDDGSDHRHLFHVDGQRTRDRLTALGMTLRSTDADLLTLTLSFLIRTGDLPAAPSQSMQEVV